MKLIQSPNILFGQLLDKQKKADGINYRLLTYCLEQQCAEGVLLYNTLSCEMVLLQGDEQSRMLAMPYLVEQRFVVPEDFDDMKFAKEYRSLRELLCVPKSDLCSYTILPTTDCNARCFYCYELGRSRIMMTEKTANVVADYIIGNYRSLPDDARHEVHLGWFGGEPLYNNKVIDVICKRLAGDEVPYRSTMVSNGYLFDAELVQKASSLWNLKSVQVTLDGTENVYNRSKNYIYGEGSAYQRVLRNVGLLLESGIKVSIRMNIDMHNADDLIALAHEIKNRFGGNKGLHCYSHPLFEVISPTGHTRSLDRRKKVYEKQQKLGQLLRELGLHTNKRALLKDIPFSHCKADGGRSEVIAPTGQIGLCEQYTESEFFSHIDTPDQRDETVVARFRERCEDLALCHDCPVYPQCIRLRMCEEDSLCFPEIRAEKTENIRKAMLAKYESWKAKQNATGTATEPVTETEDDTLQNC